MIKELEKGSIILFIMIMVANVCNYLFQIVMGRLLSVEDYGTLNALFSLLVITSVPSGTISLIISKYIAGYNATEEQFKIKIFLRKSIIYIGSIALIAIMLGIGISPFIKTYLQVEKLSHVVFIMVTMGLTFLFPIVTGIEQGFKNFWNLGMLNLISPLIKLIVGFCLVFFGFKLNGAVGALVFGSFASVIIGFFMIKKYLILDDIRDVMLGRKDIIKYSIPVLIAGLCITVLTNMDMILIKHYFQPQDSGLYSSAVIFGRMIFYFPTAIVTVMFPIVAEASATNRCALSALKKSLLYSAVLCGASVIALYFFTEPIISLFFGAKYIPAIPYIKLLSITMFPLCLLSVLVNYNLAINKTTFLIISLSIGCLAALIIISFYHNTIYQVLYTLLGMGVLLFITNFYTTIYNSKKKLTAH